MTHRSQRDGKAVTRMCRDPEVRPIPVPEVPVLTPISAVGGCQRRSLPPWITPVHAIAPEKAYPQARSRTAAQSRDAHAATGKRKEGAQQAGPGYRGPRYEGSPPKYKPGGSDKPGDAMPVGHK